MKIGRKRHRVTIERATSAQTATGAMGKTWTSRGQVWAEITPQRGDEASEQMQLSASVVHTIRLRRTGAAVGLTPADRITYQGRTFELTSVADIGERNREIECQATEATA
jgi:SPP1 family predicted phage head-tail adaptor